MIDKVLGFDQPAPRRRKTDNASESSSKIETSVPSTTSPARPIIKKVNTEEIPYSQPEPEEIQETPVVTQSVNRTKPKLNLAKPQTKPEKPEPKASTRTPSKTEHEEEIASPAVKHIAVAQLPRGESGMKSSAKQMMRESMRGSMRGSALQRAPPQSDSMYKLKLIAFLIVSLLLTIYAMTPARKTTSRRRK